MVAENIALLCASPAIVLAIFLALRFFTIRAQVSELDDLGFINIIMAFSLSLVVFLHNQALITNGNLLEILCTIFSFYFGILITSKLLKIQTSFEIMGKKIRSIISDKNNQKSLLFFIYASFTIFVAFASFFTFMQIAAGESADDRIVFADNNRLFNVLRNGGYLILYPLSILTLLINKKSKSLRLFIIIALLTLTSGSKGAIIGLLFGFMLTRGIARGKLKSWEDAKIIIPFGSIGVVFGFLVLLMYSGDLSIAAKKIVIRLFFSGDIYIFSYVSGAYEKLFDFYSPIAYLSHPFLKMLGLQGYEHPMGIMIAADVYKSLQFGPNPHFSILSLIFTHGNLILASLLCFGLGCIVVLLKAISIEILHIKKIPHILRLIIFFTLFPCAGMFIDIGGYQQRSIAIAIVAVMIGMAYEFLGGTYSKQCLTKKKELT
ncbi:MAG: hypothetical protein GY804_01760 [Alphaproteobacteria bacterium]|nr:hypothetical protein [Alphaproteobacteria bacterium]